MTDATLLKEKIRESGLKVNAICDKCGLTTQSFYNKLNGKYEFTASEIVNLSYVLCLTMEERDQIFFAQNV